MADISIDISKNDDDCQVNKFFTDLYPCNLLSTGDMVGYNKSLKKEGGSHTTNYFCIYCDENRYNIYIPRSTTCNKIFQELNS